MQVYGQRVELGEIENHLNAHPQIERALAIYLRDNSLDKIFVFLQLKTNQTYREKDLREFLSKELPSYMIPHEFFQIDQIPIRGSNKVDYEKLKEMAKNQLALREPDQELERGQKKLSLLSDQELTKEIKTLWIKYLGEKELSDQDSFFDVGGDSILAVELYQSICERFDCSPDPYIFYTKPTIKNIVKTLRESPAKSLQKTQPPLPAKQENLDKQSRIDLKNIKLFFFELFLKAFKFKNKLSSFLGTRGSVRKGPQSPQQKSFLFLKQIFKESYNGLFSIPIEGSIHKEEFKKAVQLLIQSQESLRTLFKGEHQIVLSEEAEDILFYDLRSQNKEEQKENLKKIEDKLLKTSLFLFPTPFVPYSSAQFI